ncbi:ATP-binding protein [Desulfobacterales bacterium HSG16]|nr:ATP-binding protein [Desulfobacterales bacterium HSG16]
MNKTGIITKKNWKELIRYFLIVLLPLAMIIIVVTILIYFAEIKAQTKFIQTSEHNTISMLMTVITHDFETIVSDLIVMAENNELVDLIESGETKYRKALEKEFASFAAGKKLYNQVRFLDETGMEIVRVNYNKKEAYAVPDHNLQFKGKRYYFRDTFVLKQKEIFISPLDLNVEYGKIEIPLKPIIRLGTPVFDSDGRKRGIILFNYFGAKIIRNLEKTYINSKGELMLINRDGFWLKCPVPEDQWGFMYEGKREKTFQKAFPVAWQTISNNRTGQFFDNRGLFTFTTVYPLRLIKSGTEKASASSIQDGQITENSYYWKIISYIPPEILKNAFRDAESRFVQLNLSLFPLIIICSWLLALAYVRRRRDEDTLKKAKESAESANRAKSEFLASMSHELRSPLHVVLGFSRMTGGSRHLHPEHRKNLNTVIQSGEHLLKMIEDVLDMSKIETGRIRLEERSFDLYGFLDELEQNIRVRAEDKGLQLTFKCFPNTPRYVKADKDRLRQVLENLLDNAVKFSREGKVAVRVKSYKNLSVPHLGFEVEDAGSGIPAEAADTLFEAFAQTKHGDGWQEGTGLGLAVSYRLVQLMGGKMTVISPKPSDFSKDSQTSEILSAKSRSFRLADEKMSESQGSIFRFDIQVGLADSSDLPDSSHTDSLIVEEQVMQKELTALPPELLMQLKQAAIGGNTDEIEVLIEKIRPHDAESANTIATLAHDYEHDKILELIYKNEVDKK